MSGAKTGLRRRANVDRIGALASSACAIHCAVGALLPAASGVLGLGAVLSHEAEWILTALAIALAGLALDLGGAKMRSPRVIGALTLGVVGLIAARILEESGLHALGATAGVLAGLTLLFGHVSGLRAARSCSSMEA